MDINTVIFTTSKHQITFKITGYINYMLQIQLQEILAKNWFFLHQNTFNLDLHDISNISCNFGGDLMMMIKP